MMEMINGSEQPLEEDKEKVFQRSILVTKIIMYRLWRYKIDKGFRSFREVFDYLLKKEGY